MIRCMYPCLILTVLMLSLIAILDYTIPIQVREAYRQWACSEVFRIGSFVVENRHVLGVMMFLIFVVGGSIYFYYYTPIIEVESKKEKEVEKK